ncbi:hypothetical protein EDB87DRAFT_1697328 [Lactarius vividus]|nr:hypothetical protein EDB87DRAFT_1697328 [Lactarius vividus]
MTDAANQAAWYQSFLTELGYEVDNPIPLHEDSSPVKFVAWSPAKDPWDAEAQAAKEAEARERLWKFHQSRALHLRAAILATQYMIPQDPPQRPED